MYCPERDFAYNYPRMVGCVIRAFNSDLWPELLSVLSVDFPGGKDQLWQEICTLKDRYCEFLNTCCHDPAESIADVLKRTGVQDVSPAAKVAWFAMLGEVVTGQLFQGVRDITVLGTQSPSIVSLLASGRAAANALNNITTEKSVDKLSDNFNQTVRALRESGLSQQEIRDMLSKVFSTEDDLTVV